MNILTRIDELEKKARRNRIIPGENVHVSESFLGTVINADIPEDEEKYDGDIITLTCMAEGGISELDVVKISGSCAYIATGIQLSGRFGIAIESAEYMNPVRVLVRGWITVPKSRFSTTPANVSGVIPNGANLTVSSISSFAQIEYEWDELNFRVHVNGNEIVTTNRHGYAYYDPVSLHDVIYIGNISSSVQTAVPDGSYILLTNGVFVQSISRKVPDALEKLHVTCPAFAYADVTNGVLNELYSDIFNESFFSYNAVYWHDDNPWDYEMFASLKTMAAGEYYSSFQAIVASIHMIDHYDTVLTYQIAGTANEAVTFYADKGEITFDGDDDNPMMYHMVGYAFLNENTIEAFQYGENWQYGKIIISEDDGKYEYAFDKFVADTGVSITEVHNPSNVGNKIKFSFDTSAVNVASPITNSNGTIGFDTSSIVGGTGIDVIWRNGKFTISYNEFKPDPGEDPNKVTVSAGTNISVEKSGNDYCVSFSGEIPEVPDLVAGNGIQITTSGNQKTFSYIGPTHSQGSDIAIDQNGAISVDWTTANPKIGNYIFGKITAIDGSITLVRASDVLDMKVNWSKVTSPDGSILCTRTNEGRLEIEINLTFDGDDYVSASKSGNVITLTTNVTDILGQLTVEGDSDVSLTKTGNRITAEFTGAKIPTGTNGIVVVKNGQIQVVPIGNGVMVGANGEITWVATATCQGV